MLSCLLTCVYTNILTVILFSLVAACEDQGVEHFEGESWPSHNSPCEKCECQGGKVVCLPITDCPEKCSHGIVTPTECCSQCTGNPSDG